MMKRVLSLLACLCATLTLIAAVPAPDSLLASDTLAVLTVPDYAKAKSIWGQWPSTRLWNDPAIKPFRDKFTAKFKSEFLEPMERELGIKLSDYTDLAQGQVTFALTQNEWDGKSDKTPGFLLLVDSKDKSDLLKTNLTALRKKWVDSGKQVRTDKIRDIEFTTLVFNSDEVAKTLQKALPKDKDKEAEKPEAGEEKAKPRKIELLLGQSGSLLVVGNSVKDVEKVLIRQTAGSVPSLGEQAAFAAHAKMFRDASTYGWVNLKPIIENLSKSFKAGAAPAPGLSPEKIISAAGFNGLQTLAFNHSDSPDGFSAQFQLNVPEASRKGLFKMLSFEAKDAAPLPFVPADAVKFSRFRVDMQKMWNTFENMMGEINPQFAGGIKMMVDLAGKDKDPNFDLRKSLLSNLGDDIISYQKAPRSQSFQDLSSPPTLFLISSAKAEQLAASIRAVSAFMPQAAKVKEREFLGRKVYTMNLPSVGQPGAKRDRVLSYAASGGYVVFSADVATFEEYLRGNTASALRDAPGLAEAAQKIGGMGTGLFGYENQAETMRAALETLKKESGTLAKMFGSAFGPKGDGKAEGDDKENKVKEWFDFALLPSFDRIAKYFSISVWNADLTSEGFNFKLFSPTPPQLKK
jgi:hypothetical protein